MLLASLPSSLQSLSSELQKKERYYPLVQQLIKRATGASRMHIFDDTVRNGFFAYAVPLHNMCVSLLVPLDSPVHLAYFADYAGAV